MRQTFRNDEGDDERETVTVTVMGKELRYKYR